MLIDGAGCWFEIHGDGAHFAGRPALFLDRDGVIIVDHGYISRAAQVDLVGDILPLIASANAAIIPVIIVTNQSGIARGPFGWDDFARVQGEMIAQLARHDVWIDAVAACGHYPDHPWRKPAPGMILHAAAALRIDLAQSVLIGDKPSDIEAGIAAGLDRAILIDDRTPLRGIAL